MNHISTEEQPGHPRFVGRDRSPRPRETWRQAAVWTAVVAGVFSALVTAMLLVDLSRRIPKDPLELREYQVLKADLAERPDDEQLKQQIRQLDLTLRKAYFRHRRFTAVGTWLLSAGVVIFLCAAKAAVTLRRRLPMPQAWKAPEDTETRMTRVARWAIAVLLLLLVGTVFVLSRGIQSEIPEDAQALAALIAPASADAQREQPVENLDRGYYPSDEAILANWPRFRGPGGLGIANHADVPTSWNGVSGEAILWKTAVPLVGNNSPVLWDKRVFLSGADERRREVYCFDADTGQVLWQKAVPGTPESTAEPPDVLEDTGYAAPTTATDGRRVFAIFANGDACALDFAGNLVWSKSLGMPENSYGHASSLSMYQDRLLIQLDQGSAKAGLSKLLALDAATGETVWSVARQVPSSWPTPIVIQAQAGPEIITCADPWVIAYNAVSGEEIWRADCLQADVGPSPVFADGVVYVVNEYPCLTAIRADGSGDVTGSHILWQGEDGLPDTASPLATGKYVFLLASYGILTCYDTAGGAVLWEEEFDATFTSSPSMVGNRIYLFDADGKCWVVEPGAEGCRTISEADLGEPCVTSPAFADGRIYIRGEKHLFCIGEASQ